MTRRKFLYIFSTFSVLTSFFPSSYFFSSQASEAKNPLRPQRLLKDRFKFFTPYQATVIEEVTSLIVPSDNSPGAREARVLFEIDKSTAKNQALKHSYAKGIEALDLMAKQLAGRDNFLDLSQNEMMEILNMADATKSLSGSGSFPNQYGNMLPGILLINHLIPKTIEIFYMSKAGWKVVGYQGPPQWKGNLDYAKCGS